MFNHLLTSAQDDVRKVESKIALISINPDLKTDFGHFLNYEKRINQMCDRLGIMHHCLASTACKIDLPYLTPMFSEDSGHYCLHRRAASGKEHQIGADLHKRIITWLNANLMVQRYDEVILFIYMGSTRLAAVLSCFEWPSKVRVVTNAFWDFLSPLPDVTDPDLTRLMLQDQVRHFLMSISHQRLVQKKYGLHFPYVPHPPALVSDSRFFEILRECTARKAVRETRTYTLFLPGLMTAGKGKEETEELCLSAGTVFKDHELLARDRSGELKAALGDRAPRNLRLAHGDFTDAEIINFYSSSDIILLPYSSATFNFRTSAALVDCLMTGAVPVVFPNTWLADICVKYDFGVVCAKESVASMIGATLSTIDRLSEERLRILPGAARFMQNNSWRAFMDALIRRVGPDQAQDNLQPACEAPNGSHGPVVDRTEASDVALRLSRLLLGNPALSTEVQERYLTDLAVQLCNIAEDAPIRPHLERVLAFYRHSKSQNV